MKTPVLIAIIASAILAVVLMTNMSQNMNEYSDFESARKTGKQVHIVAEWVRKDEVKNETNLFSFYLKDSLGVTAPVHYYDPMPVNFDHAKKIVVAGKYQDSVFVADQILMKCPSKYNNPDTKVVSQ